MVKIGAELPKLS